MQLVGRQAIDAAKFIRESIQEWINNKFHDKFVRVSSKLTCEESQFIIDRQVGTEYHTENNGSKMLVTARVETRDFLTSVSPANPTNCGIYASAAYYNFLQKVGMENLHRPFQAYLRLRTWKSGQWAFSTPKPMPTVVPTATTRPTEPNALKNDEVLSDTNNDKIKKMFVKTDPLEIIFAKYDKLMWVSHYNVEKSSSSSSSSSSPLGHAFIILHLGGRYYRYEASQGDFTLQENMQKRNQVSAEIPKLDRKYGARLLSCPLTWSIKLRFLLTA